MNTFIPVYNIIYTHSKPTQNSGWSLAGCIGCCNVLSAATKLRRLALCACIKIKFETFSNTPKSLKRFRRRGGYGQHIVKRWVLSSVSNPSKLADCLNLRGRDRRSFQMVGHATLKARSAVTALVRGTSVKGHPVAGSQRSTWQMVVNQITQIRWSRQLNMLVQQSWKWSAVRSGASADPVGLLIQSHGAQMNKWRGSTHFALVRASSCSHWRSRTSTSCSNRCVSWQRFFRC